MRERKCNVTEGVGRASKGENCCCRGRASGNPMRRCVGDEGERAVVVFVEKGELCVSWQRARVNFSNSAAALRRK